MKKTININYRKGKGFVRVTVMGASIDVLGSVWEAFVIIPKLADPRGKAGQVTMSEETLIAILEDSNNVIGNAPGIQTLRASLCEFQGEALA